MITPGKIFKRSLRLLYYSYFYGYYRKKILSSLPLACDRASRVQIHVLTCQKDFIEALWALKTFYHYSGVRWNLIIHDDGSLEGPSIEILQRHFINSTVIRKKEADPEIKSYLKAYKYCLRYRFEDLYSPYAIKLFDFCYYSQGHGIMAVDSDILFFQKPIEILQHISRQMGFFLNDYRNSYSLDTACLNRTLGFKIVENVNAGLIHIPANLCQDLSFIDKLLMEMERSGFPDSHWAEQTIFAIIVSKFRNNFTRLSDLYQISRKPVTRQAVSHHFCTDGSRINFYAEGLRRLKSDNFLVRLKDAPL